MAGNPILGAADKRGGTPDDFGRVRGAPLLHEKSRPQPDYLGSNMNDRS